MPLGSWYYATKHAVEGLRSRRHYRIGHQGAEIPLAENALQAVGLNGTSGHEDTMMEHRNIRNVIDRGLAGARWPEGSAAAYRAGRSCVERLTSRIFATRVG